MTVPTDAELLALCEKATPGPWVKNSVRLNDIEICVLARGLAQWGIKRVGVWSGAETGGGEDADADFIAAAREALPRLIAEKREAESFVRETLLAAGFDPDEVAKDMTAVAARALTEIKEKHGQESKP